MCHSAKEASRERRGEAGKEAGASEEAAQAALTDKLSLALSPRCSGPSQWELET